ncbi:MFS transporter [Pseudonocardia sp. TRM90224]|uniref:MFS transporter n=1 Tax=Pseudonocardia sp. TRM90224 TaxID=2812678 RepID=UPI001E487299|nr:MFS transporter [Pseudonocardia sp. TRM90224]
MTDALVDDATPKAGRRVWLGLVVLLLPSLLVSMDMSVLFFALPALAADLAPSSSQQLWIADIYGFLLAGLLVTMGSLGDIIGRRRLLMIGGAAFGAASVLAAFASSAEMLIGARALLGVAGATLAPSTLSLIRSMFTDDRQRTTAIAMWTAAFAGGSLVGPVIGGILLEHFWWGSVFLINVPAMVVLLVAGPLLLPEHRGTGTGKFDITSAVLSLAAVLPVIYGIKKTAEDGLTLANGVAVVVGLAFGAAFLRRQRRPDTMIDLTLFRRREFAVSIGTNMLTLFAIMGFGIASSQYMQLVLGFSPFVAALWSVPMFVAMMIGTVVAAVATRWTRPAYVAGGGLVVATCGFGWLSQLQIDSSIGMLVGASSLMACGIGLVAALATDLVLASAPPERAGEASSLSETGAEFGAALGMAVLGTAGVAVYRGELAATMPAGVPATAAEVATDTLGGAVDVAGGLPAAIGEPLLEAARLAFVSGVQVTAVVGAVVVGAAAVLATVMLRHVQPR